MNMKSIYEEPKCDILNIELPKMICQSPSISDDETSDTGQENLSKNRSILDVMSDNTEEDY